MFEAQARDEAGWGDEFGHKDMWFLARDIAFEDPDVEDLTEQMLFRLGVTPAPGRADADRRRRSVVARRTRGVFADLPMEIEALIGRMVNLLLVEISAAHLFAWAEELLADDALVAGEGEAARLVSYIRQDESPHVEYLRTTLSEMRDRDVRDQRRRSRSPATAVIETLWARGLAESTGERRANDQRMARAELEQAIGDRRDRDELLADLRVARVAPTRGGGMKFGVFYEHQHPRPWEEGSEQQLIQDALEQIELADALGIDYVWEVEHHFLEEYSHSSAPEVFLAAASQRTKRIRLGHGIVQTPPPFNHPARIAERIAMLDLVSNGRVDFGTGESSSEAELGGFLIDPTVKREMWEEGLRVALRCLAETPFTGHAGPYVTMPPRNVVPKPRAASAPAGVGGVQPARHDPARGAEGDRRARRSRSSTPRKRASGCTDYHATMEADGVPIGDAVNSEVACVTTFMCHEDEETALARGIAGANFFGYSLAHYYVFGRHQPGVTDVWAEYEQRRTEQGFDPEAVAAAAVDEDRLGAKIVDEGTAGLRGAVGTPDQVREYLRRYEEAGVDQVIFTAQAGKNRHEHIMESLELFGREVLPEFVEREPAAAEQRAQRTQRMTDTAHAAQAGVGPPAAADARLLVPGDPAPHGRPLRIRRLPRLARPVRRAVGRRRRPDARPHRLTHRLGAATALRLGSGSTRLAVDSATEPDSVDGSSNVRDRS